MAVGFGQAGTSAYNQVYGGSTQQDPYSANLNFDLDDYSTGSGYQAPTSYGAGNASNLYNTGMSLLSSSSNAGVKSFMAGPGGMALGLGGLALTAYSMYSSAESQAEANKAQMAQIKIGMEDIKGTLPAIHKDQKMDVFKQEYQTQTAYNTYADSINNNYDQFVDNVTKASKRKGAVKTGEEEQVENKLISKVKYQSDQLDEKLSFDAAVKSYETERKYEGIYHQISRKLRDLEYQYGQLGMHDTWQENIFG
tara:strand:- start:4326 stop:5081 length:756 start_codon:yes stop_codon:yes gene_type:complete